MYLWLQTWLILGIFVEFHFHFPLVFVQVFMVVDDGSKMSISKCFCYDFWSRQIT